MKRMIFAALLGVLLTSCDKEPTVRWDYPNVNVSIAVTNSAGENLLDPYQPKSIVRKGVKVVWNGEEYPLQNIPATRSEGPDLPVFRGLTLGLSWDGTAGMNFGEFSIDTRDYRDETFTLSWEGASHQIAFDLYATSGSKNEEPVIHQVTRLDGKLNSEDLLSVTIVVP